MGARLVPTWPTEMVVGTVAAYAGFEVGTSSYVFLLNEGWSFALHEHRLRFPRCHVDTTHNPPLMPTHPKSTTTTPGSPKRWTGSNVGMIPQ